MKREESVRVKECNAKSAPWTNSVAGAGAATMITITYFDKIYVITEADKIVTRKRGWDAMTERALSLSMRKVNFHLAYTLASIRMIGGRGRKVGAFAFLSGTMLFISELAWGW